MKPDVVELGRRALWASVVTAVILLFLASIGLQFSWVQGAPRILHAAVDGTFYLLVGGCLVLLRDRRRRNQARTEQQTKVLEMIARGKSLAEVLGEIIDGVEAKTPYFVGVYLFREGPESQLYCAMHRKLPEAIVTGIEDFRQVESLAVDTNQDLQGLRVTLVAGTMPWQGVKRLPGGRTLRAIWSIPLHAGDQEALGSFAVFSTTRRYPSRHDARMIRALAHIASLAIEREKRNEEIRRLAYHDSLTGLPNRRLFTLRANYALASTGPDRHAAVMVMDVDNFKSVNDTFGHVPGDGLIQAVASRLDKVIPTDATLARIGGDEFALVIPRVGGRDQLKQLAEQVLEQLRQPIRIDTYELATTISVGIAIYPEHGIDLDTLFRNADAAMYSAKRSGRNTYEFYDPGINANFYERLLLESHISRAMENQEFTLVYQPRVRGRDGRIVGVEALLRWQHPELGNVPPSEFIAIAEETGWIVPIGNWVLENVCRQARIWKDQGIRPVRIAVNVSGRQLLQDDFAAKVHATLLRHRVHPDWIELEITESALIRRVTHALAALNELRQLGIMITIDDFGTGYSSLTRLASLPLDTIKIDKLFIRDMVGHPEKMAVTTAIIALGHTLNLKVVAEGVETTDQQAILVKEGCDEMQGFLFSRPIDARDVEWMLRETISLGGA
ncbi:MAG: EAL domain-containing protein [Alicyclobacillus herbarius]|uniref:putative bifunctional diguanylate cyclase/phosphodiesterase n=1 Tax=Alicyclobacillus herbarius TaxID=122960 RepID=UPI002357E8B0|nr:EAL domain-containing protein [Alicyclobacillus herbarius]MCL6632953.1 EAL domain-containing protein [Alicyclobacillus herbarius]